MTCGFSMTREQATRLVNSLKGAGLTNVDIVQLIKEYGREALVQLAEAPKKED